MRIDVRTWKLILVVALLFGGTQSAFADRLALVIGNSDYTHVAQLANPKNDSEDISASLQRIGFSVTQVTNLAYRDFRLALRDFAQAAENAEVALIYFAGHGIEIEQQNYLIPVDAELRRDRDVEFEAIRLTTIVESLSGVSGLKLVLVDACRDNPFLQRMNRTSATRSIGRGLGRIDPPGVLVGYAARSGTLALDGDGRNSPYAQALLEHIEEPGLELGKLFRKVRDRVFDLTNGSQEPFVYGSLPGTDIFLVPPQAADPERVFVSNPAVDAYLNADKENTEAAWAKFIDDFSLDPGATDLIDQAETRLAALQTYVPPAPIEGNGETAPDVVSRACDKHASDPFDPNRPPQMPGVAPDQIDVELALSVCLRALDRSPDFARTYYNLYRIHLAAGSPDDAITALVQSADLGYSTAQKLTGAGGESELAAALLNRGLSSEEMEAALDLSSAERASIQASLQDLGFEAGPADGQFGPKSRKAIATFQRFAELTETGFLNELTSKKIRTVYEQSPETYEGEYLIFVFKRFLGPPNKNPYGPFSDSPNSGSAKVVNTDGKLRLVKGTDFTSVNGPWFKDFSGNISATGKLSASFTVNKAHGGKDPYLVRISRALPKKFVEGHPIEVVLGKYKRDIVFIATITRLNASD